MLCFSLSPELGTVRCCTSATWMHFAHCTRTKQGNSLSGITFGKPLKTIEGYGLTISYFRQLWQFDSRPARSTKNRGRRKSRLTTRPSFSRWLLNIGLDMSKLAERVGFEPTLEFPLNTLSKRAPSATRPSLRHFALNECITLGQEGSCCDRQKHRTGLPLDSMGTRRREQLAISYSRQPWETQKWQVQSHFGVAES